MAQEPAGNAGAQGQPSPAKEGPSEPSFWDGFPAMLFLVAAIVFARWFILEPFKIPSGSMEPTLFGHEDYGDRIVTNKLAYVTPGRVWLVAAVSAALIALGFLASKSWRSIRATIIGALIAVGVIGGIFFAWARDAVASQPQRFEVVVFQYNEEWSGKAPKDINYIKRLVGLPGDQIVVSGGDLYLRKGGKDEIVRKWKERPEMQETVWYPVAKAWSPFVHERPKPNDPRIAEIQKQIETLRFPWKGAEAGTPGAALESRSLRLDGTAPVTLTYGFDVTNIYLKQGRWPFTHVGCPLAHLPGIQTQEGAVVRNPASRSESITAYVANTWEGVQCPNCKEIVFPIASTEPGNEPLLKLRSTFDDGTPAKFFYGGDHIVGDLRLDLEINVESAGSIALEVGCSLHRALWSIGGQPPAVAADDAAAHAVQTSAPPLAPGKHTLSLAYVDATVIALLDGKEFERRLIDVQPPGRAANGIDTVARVTFEGLRGTLTRLNLWRDLYYTCMLQAGGPARRALDEGSDIDRETGNYVSRRFRDGEYMMMGDNSPSSSDGRVWGHVPREKFVGRASFVWWPPSRWRFIR
ncbi:MAG: signal peptidase I [Planctomycetota bacterium]|nr:signal peptidase I [Planctomycetota bacterium]